MIVRGERRRHSREALLLVRCGSHDGGREQRKPGREMGDRFADLMQGTNGRSDMRLLDSAFRQEIYSSMTLFPIVVELVVVSSPNRRPCMSNRRLRTSHLVVWQTGWGEPDNALERFRDGIPEQSEASKVVSSAVPDSASTVR